MSSSVKWFGTALAMVVGTVMVSPAHAVLVKDDGTTIFSDNFESPAPGNIINNGGQPGDWNNWFGTTAALTRGTETLPPPAFEGLQKAEISGSYSQPAESYMGTINGNVHVEWMQYTPGTGNYEFIFRLLGGAGPIAAISNQGGAGNNNLVDITHGVPIPLTLARNQWQKFEVDYTTGSSNITLSIDGNSHTYAMTAARESYVSVISFGGGDAGTAYYIDAIPEPATAALMGLVGLMAISRRRH